MKAKLSIFAWGLIIVDENYLNNPFPFEVINGSYLVKNWKSAIDSHTCGLPSARKQFLWIKEIFLWNTVKEKISLKLIKVLLIETQFF